MSAVTIGKARLFTGELHLQLQPSSPFTFSACVSTQTTLREILFAPRHFRRGAHFSTSRACRRAHSLYSTPATGLDRDLDILISPIPRYAITQHGRRKGIQA